MTIIRGKTARQLLPRRMAAWLAATCVVMCSAACASSPRQSPPDNAPPVQSAGSQATARIDSALADTTQAGNARADSAFNATDMSRFIRTTPGLMYLDVKLGTGLDAVDLREVEMHYRGRLEDGTIFDSSLERGMPIKFVLGQGRVIRGWDLGIRGMRVGGRRILVLPADLAYGRNGYPPRIPPNATLIFDVQLLSVR